MVTALHLPANVTQVILDQAIAWSVRLASGTATAHEEQQCLIWRDARPEHEQAWQRVQQIEASFRDLPADCCETAKALLLQPTRPRRRQSIKLAGLAFAGLGAAWLLRQRYWSEAIYYQTKTAQRLQLMLSDGTDLLLNTRTRLEAHWTPFERRFVLHEGEIALRTGPDTHALLGKRALLVDTPHARLTALGTHFTISTHTGETRLHVIDGQVAIDQPGLSRVIVQPGETWQITAAARQMQRVVTVDPSSWTDSVLVVKQIRLDDLAVELNRYHDGQIECDSRVASWRLSGVFQIKGDNAVPDALSVLEHSLPVRIANLSGARLIITPR